MSHLDAVADADFYFENLAKENKRLKANAIKAGEQIREAFNTQTPLPYVAGATWKLAYMPYKEAATDVICDDKVFPVFLEALKTSECPKVKALIAAMADKYVSMWADEVGGVLA